MMWQARYVWPSTQAGKRLYHILQIPKTESSLRGRIKDCEKQVNATRNEIEFLKTQIGNVAGALREAVNRSTKDLFQAACQQMKANNPAAARDVMLLFFAGSAAFSLLDRLTGRWTVIWTEWAKYDLTYQWILPSTAFWFYAAMVVWLILGFVVVRYLRYAKAGGVLRTRTSLRLACD